MNYQTFKNRNSKVFNKFISDNVFFAFDDKQFKEGLKKFNIEPEQAKDKLFRYFGGGFILKTAAPMEHKISKKMTKCERKYLNKAPNLISALVYEMGNRECGYTGNYFEAVRVLGLADKFKKSRKVQRAYIKAKRQFIKQYC